MLTTYTTGIGNSGLLGPAVTSHTSTASDGDHYFNVVSTDAAGNTNTSACSPLMTVDKTAPAQATAPTWAEGVPHNTVNVNASWTLSTAPDIASQDIAYYTNGTCSVAEGTSATLGSAVTSHPFTGAHGNTYYYRITTTDTAGNTSLSDCSNPMMIDTVAPTLSAISIASNNSDASKAKVGNIITVSFTASEALGGTPTVQINGNATSVSGSNPYNATYTMTGGDIEGSVTFTIDFFDQAGNSGTQVTAVTNGSSVVFDKTAPTVTINQATTETVGACSFTAPSDPSNSAAIQYKVLTNEPVLPATFTTADITNAGTGGSTSISWTIQDCGDNQSFKVSTTTIFGDGTIIPQIGASAITYFSGNGNPASTSTDNTVAYDGTPPANATGLGWSESSPFNAVGVNASWTLSVSPDVASQTIQFYTDSSCTGGNEDGSAIALGAVTTTQVYTGTNGITHGYEITTIDNAGNTSTSGCSSGMEIDTAPPTDNAANPQFTDAIDGDGNDIAVTWTAFSDTNLSDHRITTYTDSGCTTGMTDHGLTGFSTNSNSTIVG